MYNPNQRLVILAQGYLGTPQSKTAEGMIRYGKNPIVAVIDETYLGKTVEEVLGVGEGVPFVSNVEASLRYEPDALLIGIATLGGFLPAAWGDHLGFAKRLRRDQRPSPPPFRRRRNRRNRPTNRISDLGRAMPPEGNPVALGLAAEASAQVVLTVGTDCDAGKMTAALEIVRGAEKVGRKAGFLATGQTGIMVSGSGIPLDRVIGDFMAGFMEELILEQAKHHDLLVVEGQGSLYHPGYSRVTLSLLHGCAPSTMILCHELGKTHIEDTKVALPTLSEVVRTYETMAAPVRPAKVVGIALKGRGASDEQVMEEMVRIEQETGLPTTDCLRFGPKKLVEAVCGSPSRISD